MNAAARKSPPLLRILVSETDEWLADIIADVIHDMAKLGVSLAAITPPTIRDTDLLETAAKQHFDMGVLLVNNVFYEPYDLSTRGDRICHDSVAFVTRIVQLFDKPIIALYGWPAVDSFATKLMEAGATAAFRIPCVVEDIQQALKRCLPIW